MMKNRIFEFRERQRKRERERQRQREENSCPATRGPTEAWFIAARAWCRARASRSDATSSSSRSEISSACRSTLVFSFLFLSLFSFPHFTKKIKKSLWKMQPVQTGKDGRLPQRQSCQARRCLWIVE